MKKGGGSASEGGSSSGGSGKYNRYAVQTQDAKPAGNDAVYTHDAEKLEALREQKPWMQDVKYFKVVKISPSAAMKMLMHACSGVDKGVKAGGNPTEIMGLLMGRPDVDNPGSLIVTDAFPLPIEGAETRVLADDVEVANYMIDLVEALEVTRKERFMGWYHSHPFDLAWHSHCYLSSTDISTQLAWQRSEDPHGNPWLAIVVDPLRSLSKGRPEFGAFRAYPPEHPAAFEAPDGAVVSDEQRCVALWGTCWKSYYTLQIEYFMSSLAANVLGILSENFLWMRTLTSTSVSEEDRERFAERVVQVSEKLEHSSAQMSHGSGMSYGGAGGAGSGPGAAAAGEASSSKEDSALAKATRASSGLAIEHCQAEMTQLIKSMVFGAHSAEGSAPAPGPS